MKTNINRKDVNVFIIVVGPYLFFFYYFLLQNQIPVMPLYISILSISTLMDRDSGLKTLPGASTTSIRCVFSI